MTAHEVDAYLAGLSEDKRATLEKVRRSIRAAAPKATEGLSYGMPAFFMQGKAVAGYRANSAFCSYYPMSGSTIETLKAELRAYATSKGAIRFPIGDPPPAALIKRLVATRIEELS